MDRARGQGIIAGDFVSLAHHECPRSAASLIGKYAPFQPLIEGNDTRVKIPYLVAGANRLGSRYRQAHSQGAEVFIVCCNRSLGWGDASKRARNSA